MLRMTLKATLYATLPAPSTPITQRDFCEQRNQAENTNFRCTRMVRSDQ